MITVYVIYNPESNFHYIGITNNHGRRLREHRRKESKGSSKLGGYFNFLLREEYRDYATARAREKYLKAGNGRSF